jgi:subtilisin family serine protease
MRNHSYPVLKSLVIGLALTAMLFSIPAGRGQLSDQMAIVKIKAGVDPVAITNRYSVTLVDSVTDLKKYLVKGSSTNLANLIKDNNVQQVEYDLQAEISESAILAESTVALLDPDAVGLLYDDGQTWDGQHWIKSSVFRQPGLQVIQFTPSTTPSDPVTVAVIDTGVDPLHPALVGSIVPGKNFIDESRGTDEMQDLSPATAALLLQRSLLPASAQTLTILNPSTVTLLDPAVIASMKQSPTPYFGHGTMVSGLIHTVAPNALIMPLKVFDASGRGTSFRIAKAIVYAVNAGASVINMSFDLDTYSDLVDDAVDYAAHNNVVMVASVGNTNSKMDRIYPASDNKVFGVAATDLQDHKANFSNYGPVADLAAPGMGLISPYPAGLYAVWSGTSASAALVSGEAALLFSQIGLKAPEVMKRVGDRVDPLHDKYPIGKGRINLKNALRK